MALQVRRMGAVFSVAELERSLAFCRDRLGVELEALYRDSGYETMTRVGGRLSLAQQGHRAEDRPGIEMATPPDPSRLPATLVEVVDCLGAYKRLRAEGARFLAEPDSPPWGGHRCSASDPDHNLVELEQPA